MTDYDSMTIEELREEKSLWEDAIVCHQRRGNVTRLPLADRELSDIRAAIARKEAERD